MTLVSARRIGPALSAAGLVLMCLGLLACTRGSWPLAILGALSIVVGGLVVLIGLGVRARLSHTNDYEHEAELDATLMAAIRRSGSASCDESGTPCSSCDLGCAPRSHP